MAKLKVKVKFVNVTYGNVGREVVAFFMYQNANRIYERGLVIRDAYVHEGQHCGICEHYMRQPQATKEQYTPLLKEMQGLGYDITVMNKDK